MKFFDRLARIFTARAALAGVFAVAAAAVLVPGAPAQAGTYVDTAIGDLKPEDKVKVADPKPVQLLFQFKSKGAPNARATEMLKAQVVEAAKASGLFSEVLDGPAPGGAVLSVTLDNVPQEGAAAKGFATGLTFGLKGTMVTDFYNCTVDYLGGGGDAQKLTRNAQHALHTTVGLKDAPPNGVKAPNIKVAVETMTRQVVAYALNDLGGDAVFSGAVAVAAPEAVPAPVLAPVPAEAAAPAAAPQAPAPVQPAAAAAPATETGA